MLIRMKCPGCRKVSKVRRDVCKCPLCGCGVAYDMRRDAFVVAGGGVVGAEYFRTNPPGWHSVDADGKRVAKITKAEAEVIRNAQD